MGKIGGSFRECGSYYPVLTYADELWDLFYVETCQELDREFPEARLLPSHSWSLGLSPNRIETLFYKRKENPDGTEG